MSMVVLPCQLISTFVGVQTKEVRSLNHELTRGTWLQPLCSRLAMAGVSIYKISKWLGHSDVKTTMIYAHLEAQDEDIIDL